MVSLGSLFSQWRETGVTDLAQMCYSEGGESHPVNICIFSVTIKQQAQIRAPVFGRTNAILRSEQE